MQGYIRLGNGDGGAFFRHSTGTIATNYAAAVVMNGAKEW
jgi:hypothetical protein